MTDKALNEKIKIEVLLKTYSINAISNAFIQIDNKLMSLYEYSENDFLHLNREFKKLYKDSKVISKNVDILLDIFSADRNKDLYKKIKTFYNQLQSQIEIFDQEVSLKMGFLEESTTILRSLNSSLETFSQNLLRLKHLIVNLNLTLSVHKDTIETPIRFKLVEEQLNRLMQLSERISKSINDARKFSKSIYVNFEQVRNQNVLNFEDLLSNLKSQINKIEERYVDNKECIPQIGKITEQSANRISDIINKLQYQDIIKQKMEHIQKIHNDLIVEFKRIENSPVIGKNINDKVKFFLRIRDIAGLQAAQLSQANKEYQLALEIIINNFMKVGDNMQTISEMCRKVNYDEKFEEKVFDDICNYISGTENKVKNKTKQNNKLKYELNEIEYQLEQSGNYFNELKKLSIDLNQNINSYFDNINKQSLVDLYLLESIQQLKNINSNLEIEASNIDKLTNKLIPIKKRIKKISDEHINVDLGANIGEIKEIVLQLYHFRKNAELKLKENKNISKKALPSIKKSISAINYYNFFKNIIEEIIHELNTINYNLKISKDESDSTIEENLIKLKKYYTMETEHIIHEKFSKGAEIESFINNEVDGEVDFF